MVDPVTLEVIYHRLTSIADEMLQALFKSSFSPVVKEGGDASTAIFNAQGETIAQGTSHPIHLGTLMDSVLQILKRFPVSEMLDGDVYLANDPYTGGTHLPDVTLMVPVIYQSEVVALTCSMVHHQDIGAMTPGVPTSATTIYQEGLNLPPLKFYEAGKPVQVVHDIIRKNVRVPDLVIGDMRAQVAGGNVGKLRMLELFEEYGKDVVLAALKQLMDHAEVLTRQELERIPDGSYTFVDYMDNDGVDLDQRIKFQATVTIRGSDFIVDFAGTSPQVRGPFNCTPSTSSAAAAYVIRAITNPSIPNNAGSFRPIILNLPEGSIVNPHHPATTGARGVAAGRITDTIMGALVKAIPKRLPAGSCNFGSVMYLGGVDPMTGREYVTINLEGGSLGARPTKDGVDTIVTGISNSFNIPAEAQEMHHPIRVVKSVLRDDSGGAGEYRGGLGSEKVIEVLRGSASVTHRGERFYTRPWGLFGGLPGASAGAFVARKTGEKEEIHSKGDLTLKEGDQIHFFSMGGGGYGDPLKRKPELVLRDVLDRKVSLKAATDDYGVVIDEVSQTIDFEKTGELRKEREGLRGPITWTYNRGPELGQE